MGRRHLAPLMLAVGCALAGMDARVATASPARFSFPNLFSLGAPKPPPSLIFTYEGFQIDASAARRLQPPDKTVRAFKAQVDLVEHVGLRPDMLRAMRANRILADTTKPGPAFRWTPGQGIALKVQRLSPKKPVLLAGLLAAYHDQHLVGGPAGADVARFRDQALALRAPGWPRTALMLQSNDDYFALTGATYLNGAITREPYSRAKLRQTQPQYYHWLATLFDGGKARG